MKKKEEISLVLETVSNKYNSKSICLEHILISMAKTDLGKLTSSEKLLRYSWRENSMISEYFYLKEREYKNNLMEISKHI
jgi:hypothetical protein